MLFACSRLRVHACRRFNSLLQFCESGLGYSPCNFFFSSRRRHTRSYGDWSSDVCSSDLGTARFGFRHVVTDETFEILVRGDASRVVETVPGWAHNITNVGGEEMVVLLWANEVFDPQRPDTIDRKSVV